MGLTASNIRTMNLHSSKAQPVRREENLSSICEPIVATLWDPKVSQTYTNHKAYLDLYKKKQTPWPLVRKRTILTERPPRLLEQQQRGRLKKLWPADLIDG
jgi:hypothetical protein